MSFWLSDSLQAPEKALARREWWYRGGTLVDNEIRDRFGSLVRLACKSKLNDWSVTAEGAFALILLLDQFTRNLYRNTSDAYVGDAIALEIVSTAIGRGIDYELHPVQRIWLYHPFHHSEQIGLQDYGIERLEELMNCASDDWREYIRRSIIGWVNHKNIVARFGRFPHRNDTLGRMSTAEEIDFLATSGQSFGQGPTRIRDTDP